MEPGPRREVPLDRGLGKWGPRRVGAELSERALGSSACINVGGTRDVVVGFIRDWLAWREQHQFNWTMRASSWGLLPSRSAFS
jgi:hypothetical protein